MQPSPNSNARCVQIVRKALADVFTRLRAPMAVMLEAELRQMERLAKQAA